MQKAAADDSMEAGDDEEMPTAMSSTSLLAGRMPEPDVEMPASV